MDTGEIETEKTSAANDLSVLDQSSEKETVLLGQDKSKLKNGTDNATDTRESSRLDQLEKTNDYLVIDSQDASDTLVIEIDSDEASEEVSESRNELSKQNPQHQNKVPEESTKTMEDFPTKGLSGTRKRKFRILRAHGVPLEQARVMCFDTMTSIKIALGLDPERAVKPPQRAVKPASAVSHTAVGPRKSVIIGAAILPVDFPVTILSREQLEGIQEIVLDKIVSCKGSKVKPKFTGTKCRFGWLCLTCADLPTFEWLKVITNELNPYEGTTLKCIYKYQVPESVTYDAILQGSEGYDDTKILSLIENQNEKLSTSKWRIVRRIKTDLKNKITVTFSIDFESEKVLKGMRYKINYKFGQTEFRKPDNVQNASNEGQRTQLPKQKASFTKPVPLILKEFKPFIIKTKHNFNEALQPTQWQKNERFSSRTEKPHQQFAEQPPSKKAKKQINDSFYAARDYSSREHFVSSTRDSSPRDRGRDSRSRDRYSNSRDRNSNSRDRCSSSRDRYSSSRDRDTRTCKCCSTRSSDNNNCLRYEGIGNLRDSKSNDQFLSNLRAMSFSSRSDIDPFKFGSLQNGSSSGLKRKNDGTYESFYTQNKYPASRWSSGI